MMVGMAWRRGQNYADEDEIVYGIILYSQCVHNYARQISSILLGQAKNGCIGK